MPFEGRHSTDEDVRRALDWFYEVSQDPDGLQQRIRGAQSHYLASSQPVGMKWPSGDQLLLKNDLIASYLAQVDAFLTDWRNYDLIVGGKLIPFVKQIGRSVDALRQMSGAAERVRRMLNPRAEHPDGALYELVAASRYMHSGWETEFISETAERTADLRLGESGGPKLIHLECKRLRPSMYELKEDTLIRRMFASLEELIHSRRLNVSIEVTFRKEMQEVPNSYLAERVASAVSSRIVVPSGYPWSDDFAAGLVKPSKITEVRRDIADSSLLVGPKMARLLAGKYLAEHSFLLALGALPRDEDGRFVDEIEYASVLSWHSQSPDSIEARARHILSKLADVDRQLADALVGIVHIGMDAERDVLTADLRRARNLQTVQAFRAESNIAEINLHYYLPRTTQSTTWMIDETVDWRARVQEPLLDDPRLLIVVESEIESDIPAWQLEPPM